MIDARHHPFLRRICASPADDAPRLVYADFLDELGDARRADYIRVMCQPGRRAARAKPCVRPVEYRAGEIRMEGYWFVACQDEMTLADERSHVALLPPPGEFDCGMDDRDAVRIHRGFVAGVTCRWMAWEVVGRHFAWHPLTRVRLLDHWWPHVADGADRFGWYCSLTGPSHCLPPHLFHYLTGGKRDGLWRWYTSPEAARSDQSRALIRYARTLAGFHPAPASGDTPGHAAPEDSGAAGCAPAAAV